VTFSIDVLLLLWLLRRKLGRFGGRQIAWSLLRSLVCAAAMAGVLHLLLTYPLAGQRPWLIVAACVPAGVLAFFAAAKLLRAPELGELFRKA
jgi:putative peptidoglycan lipid II flippase